MSSQTKFMGDGSIALFLAWLVALGATLGALFIGEVLHQTPCVLCWYQRIAMFPLALILGIACLRDDLSIGIYVIPVALAGTAIALWHSLIYFDIAPAAIVPCEQGPSCQGANMEVFGLPIPLLSLGAFAMIILLLLHGKRGQSR